MAATGAIGLLLEVALLRRIYRAPELFQLLATFGVTLMVVLARYRFLRVFRVEFVLYAILVGYIGLLGYEYWLLHALFDVSGL